MLSLAAVLLASASAARDDSPQGFGADTRGGASHSVVHVRSLKDSGRGTLRQALSSGKRTVVFDVAGTIKLESDIPIRGSFVTIDGSSARGRGITLRGAGLRIDGTLHDVIIRGLRIRSPENDGITIKNGASNILVDHVSVDSAGDGGIDVTRGAHDVTIQWSVLSGCGKTMLLKYEAQRVSIHHNVFVDSQWRNPNVAHSDETRSNRAPTTTADVRNNLIWHWGNDGGGSILQCGAKVNLVNNYYSSPDTRSSRQADAIVDDGCSTGSDASIHASGNKSGDHLGFDINRVGNTRDAFPAARIKTTDACLAARDALATAGAEPLDSVDKRHLSSINLKCKASRKEHHEGK